MARQSFRLAVVSAVLCAVAVSAYPAEETLKATCVLNPSTGSTVTGSLTAVAPHVGGPVVLTGFISGLSPGEHGFHVHRDGSTADDCKAAGPHFNPSGAPHGAPGDHDSRRHAGDLGNIVADTTGQALISVTTDQISLCETSPLSVLKRAIVVHAKPDDLGRGGDEESTKTGNAGARLACCVITPY